jgi:DNA excision repair protein ERCC-2
LSILEEILVIPLPKWFRDDLLALYFRLRSFRRTAELYDERYVTIIESVPAVKVRLFCLDPSHLLREPLSRPLEGLKTVQSYSQR